MSTWPRYGQPVHWGTVLAVLLVIGGMGLLILGSWRLSDGLNGVVIDHTNPYIHFSETTAQQEVTDGIIYLAVGIACFLAFAILFLTKRKFLFPERQNNAP
jgi:hypothetical protein